MRYYRKTVSKLDNISSSSSKETNWNAVIFWILFITVSGIVGIYLIMGPRFQAKPQVVVGMAKSETANDDLRSIPVYERTITVIGSQIYYREAHPLGGGHISNPEILLLHGDTYVSKTWKGLGTLQLLAKNGYRAIAIDLPGFGLSKKAIIPNSENDVIQFMQELISTLRLRKIVLVVPGISGKYGKPMLLNAKMFDMIGFIAMSPNGIDPISKNLYNNVEIPVLYLYGEKDKKSLEASNFWRQNMPNCKLNMIRRGEIVPFVGNKKEFHQDLLRWLKDECQLTENDEDNNNNIISSNDNLDWGNMDEDHDDDMLNFDEGFKNNDENENGLNENEDNYDGDINEEDKQTFNDQNNNDVQEEDMDDLEGQEKEFDDVNNEKVNDEERADDA